MAVFAVLAAVGAPAAGEDAPDPSRIHYPTAIAAGADGALWVVDQTGIMRVTLDGRFERMLEAANLSRIARGPDRAMWFTNYAQARIGRIALDGGVTYFSTPRVASGITAGPDGNVWFTESDGGIGRITPQGSVTEFRMKRAVPAGITAGRDGNLWFSDLRGRIGRITPTGEIKEFPVPHNYDGPEAIAAGRDGAIWYGTDHAVGRMTTSGRARLFKLPFGAVQGIALGSRGNMWVVGDVFNDRVGAAVARVTPGGKVHIFSKGLSGIATDAITAGPGAAMSVAETARNNRQVDGIARISPRGAVRELPATQPCVVPRVARLPLALVEDAAFTELCRVDARSRRAGKRRRAVALGVSPKPGTVLPFDTPLRVRFGPVPPLPKHCRLPFAGRRLAITPDVLVFSYSDYNADGESTTHYGACLRPRGRLQTITVGEDLLDYVEEAAGFRAKGAFVAYLYSIADHYGNLSISLNVYDVRRARDTFGVSVEQHDGGGYPDDAVLREYVLSEHGAVAWAIQAGDTFHLYARGPATKQRELDSGPSLSGLAFSGDTLSWTAASGERKSAEVR